MDNNLPQKGWIGRSIFTIINVIVFFNMLLFGGMFVSARVPILSIPLFVLSAICLISGYFSLTTNKGRFIGIICLPIGWVYAIIMFFLAIFGDPSG
jgi:hypothetical protein